MAGLGGVQSVLCPDDRFVVREHNAVALVVQSGLRDICWCAV